MTTQGLAGSAVLKHRSSLPVRAHLDHMALAQLVLELNQNGQEPRD